MPPSPPTTRFPSLRLRIARRSHLLAAALVVGACTETTSGPEADQPLDIDLALPWSTAAVADAGGSPALVERGIDRARANHRMRSLLVVKDGRLVVEEYFGVGGPDDLHDVRSVTKSVVSALTGVALARGDIRSLDDPATDYLGPLVPDLDPEKRAITIRHLLTMTSGLEWDESGGFGSYSEWIRSRDHLGFLLDKPFVAAPGSRFNYNSAAVHLLGVVVEQATTMQLPTLAQFALFDPMGISRSRWESLGGGFHNGGAGLDLRPRDLARFGQLFLQRGSSGGRRIMPADWVDISSENGAGWRIGAGSLDGISSLGGTSYGYLWWVAPGAPEPLYFAWGYGGQFVVVVPDLRLVVVATNDWYRVSSDGGAGLYERLTMDVLVEDIIPAFR
ncbi:MAG: serine hydrolase [Gemmatimonadetes bacterium]|nr:serine hydrolase [Gemmatimonadota bacterium]